MTKYSYYYYYYFYFYFYYYFYYILQLLLLKHTLEYLMLVQMGYELQGSWDYHDMS